jgi:flagellar M-ring protein FliF
VSLTKYKFYNQAILEKQENSPLEDLTWEEYKFSIIEQGRAKIEEIDEDIIQLVKNSSKIDKVVVLAYEEPQFIPKIVEPSPISDYLLIGIIVIMILLLGYAVYKGTEPAEIKEIEPELSVEDMLRTTKATSELESIEFDGKSDARVEIERFVEENPDAVALLLRNWLNEDWE